MRMAGEQPLLLLLQDSSPHAAAISNSSPHAAAISNSRGVEPLRGMTGRVMRMAGAQQQPTCPLLHPTQVSPIRIHWAWMKKPCGRASWLSSSFMPANPASPAAGKATWVAAVPEPLAAISMVTGVGSSSTACLGAARLAAITAVRRGGRHIYICLPYIHIYMYMYIYICVRCLCVIVAGAGMPRYVSRHLLFGGGGEILRNHLPVWGEC